MAQYVAIIEEADPDAVSLWFPDLPGCISGGDDVDEALENAPEALALYAQDLIEDGRQLPSPRTLAELEADPELADDLRNHTAVLIEWPPVNETTE
ncbi:MULTISPECIES: type II toxin-antitoxin system HicB family antitoxin [Bradyrhizobium]|uniref:Type II toxin-antitoxin system HicB family antitoxin n=1 Tax=Bradyrhizobium vignae TaxID=1549949 RepID=A0ABS3ZN81_9BRAD|nr:type II toxin-antitoxin system HicB family antitoxin [Bradyrhizobium vignae]MBP0109624.1 type II toxin-antitoxin system HicB family antitoxin [Bradyrhizobium vignae]RXH02295.1 HicB family protein [Bradyrhizobium vignae]